MEQKKFCKADMKPIIMERFDKKKGVQVKKAYYEVNQRLMYFRWSGDYEGWSLETEIISQTEKSILMRAIAKDADGMIKATGFAHEEKSSSQINQTSHIENCETSAWGRCLANLGIGIDSSVASYDEVENAIRKQNQTPQTSPKPDKTIGIKKAVMAEINLAGIPKDEAEMYVQTMAESIGIGNPLSEMSEAEWLDVYNKIKTDCKARRENAKN